MYIFRQAANIVVALSLEALKGTRVAFRADIHNARPHTGQKFVAQKLRSDSYYLSDAIFIFANLTFILLIVKRAVRR